MGKRVEKKCKRWENEERPTIDRPKSPCCTVYLQRNFIFQATSCKVNMRSSRGLKILNGVCITGLRHGCYRGINKH